MKIQLRHNFEDIISLENFFTAWEEFVKGKRHRKDVQEFSINLVDNVVILHQDLFNYIYKHGNYQEFYVNDPKRRHIHKAPVRDRLLHHAIYRILYPLFDRTFIADSFSCRNEKGTHRALKRFRNMAYQVSHNNTRTCWVLKCDIRKFFASIDHKILLNILGKYILDKNIMWLLKEVINSHSTDCVARVGLPLGNLTSQLFANVYMNVFDQWVKHKVKAKYYLRYADDFVIFFENKGWLESLIPKIQGFLTMNLKLSLHSKKLFLQTLASGVDFLGWVHFPDHCVLRRATRVRMMKRLQENSIREVFQSYFGLLKHGNGFKLETKLMNIWQQKGVD